MALYKYPCVHIIVIFFLMVLLECKKKFHIFFQYNDAVYVNRGNIWMGIFVALIIVSYTLFPIIIIHCLVC